MIARGFYDAVGVSKATRQPCNGRPPSQPPNLAYRPWQPPLDRGNDLRVFVERQGERLQLRVHGAPEVGAGVGVVQLGRVVEPR